MNTAFDVAMLEREIETLIAEYPELAEDETLRADMLAGETNAFEVLATVVQKMQEAGAMVGAIDALLDNLHARSARYAKREQAMRTLAERVMRAADLRKAELPAATLSIRAVPPALEIVDLGELPDAFWRVTKAPDKKAIKDAIKDGQFVPGARLTNGGETISIRVA